MQNVQVSCENVGKQVSQKEQPEQWNQQEGKSLNDKATRPQWGPHLPQYSLLSVFIFLHGVNTVPLVPCPCCLVLWLILRLLMTDSSCFSLPSIIVLFCNQYE